MQEKKTTPEKEAALKADAEGDKKTAAAKKPGATGAKGRK